MRPTLEVLVEHGEQQYRDLIVGRSAAELSEDDRQATVASGEPVVRNRVGWALAYLVQGGAVRRPRRDFSVITQRGRDLLANSDGPISNSTLQQFTEFQEFLARSRTAPKTSLTARQASPDTGQHISEAESEGSPEEVIEATIATVHGALAGKSLIELWT